MYFEPGCSAGVVARAEYVTGRQPGVTDGSQSPRPRTPQAIEKYVRRSPVRVTAMTFVHDSYRTDRFGRRSQTEQNLPLVGGHKEINVIRPMTYRLMTYSVGAPQCPDFIIINVLRLLPSATLFGYLLQLPSSFTLFVYSR